MHRILALLMTLGAMMALMLIPTGSASAFGGEQLKCEIGPLPFTWGVNCFPNRITNPDDIVFQVFNESGSGYSFSWTLEGRYTLVRGCASNTDYCEVTTFVSSDHDIIATVVASQNGSSETLSSTAHVYAVCGRNWC